MLLPDDKKVEINKFYLERNASDFLGYMPVLDPDNNGYYSVANNHPEREYERVTPVFGEYNDEVMTELECWYEQESLPKGAREDARLQHEFYREEYLERVARCKYCVWFVGCDDGDKFMRFESKEDAIKFLNYIQYFDNVTVHELCQNW